MLKRIINQAIVTVLRALSLRTKKYPRKLYNKTRADFIQKMKDHNKGDN